MMIDSTSMSVSPLVDAIAELHIRNGNQEEGNRNRHENKVSHIHLLQAVANPSSSDSDVRLWSRARARQT